MKQKVIEPTNRRGTALVAVLVCLGLISVLMFSAMQTSLKQRRQLDRELQMEQTRLLAEAGLLHAMKLARSSDDLPNEPTVLTPKLTGTDPCRIEIEFTTDANETTATVTATIGLKDRPELQTRQQLTKEVKLPSGE